ncbi:hypothetical protein ASD38_14390 [Caulobacter sp. Root487D2Y]|uniref:P-loop NTPase fold protein n=1 Tax=Caulobacter sp. Root487D2Y TaxID=1736547 RepID=UPI0006FB5C05|nr:P-loop NTPase fold protein [Caulobacter sp. Root487D2Y]KQY28829.1 hypothetical protein ASD38_14390 [Caulobacter sp. Root487D2Y]
MEPSQTAADSDDGEVVRELAGAISDRLKLASKSATLDDVVASGCRHVVLDEAKREIVFDMRALYLGFLAAGLHPQKGNVGNTARWFQDWLAEKVGEAAIVSAVGQSTDLALAGRLLSSGFMAVPSISVGDLQELARSYALSTVTRGAFDARHLFAAMIERGAITDMTQRVFKVSLTNDDIDDLKRDLVEHIMRSPQRGETQDAWFQTLRLKPPPPPAAQAAGKAAGKATAQGVGQAAQAVSPPEPAPPPPPPDDAVSPFNGDTPTADDNDVLDTERDVEALAQLVCLDRVTPLAVAIFGDWGSGKSTFMAKLEQAVREMPGREAGQALPLVEEANAARFVHPIVQIRFNAWHFADANLWASLTAEFFDQLRAGGYDRSGQARHAQLVQRVNQHVHALSDTLSANRKAMAKNGKAVLEAQQARDSAAEGARKASGKALGQATLDVLSQVLADQKGLMTTLGLTRERATSLPDVATDPKDDKAPDKAGQGAEIVVGVVKDLASTFGKLKAVRRVLFRTPLRAAIAGGLALVLLACVAAGWAILFGPWKAVSAPEKWTALAGLLAATGALARTVAPVLRLVNGVAERGAAIAAEVDKADQDAVGLLLTQEAKLQSALAEAKALEEAELASAKALARYVDPTGKANPPRLLRYVLEDDPDTKALEKDIGLIGRTRRLFQAVDTIARQVRDEREAARKAQVERPGEDLPDHPDKETPERIIIYIDDLDRCHEDKVYEVLQAIHLLLAFDLFVVVVGVDVKWVQAALAQQFETGDAQVDAASEQQRNERAMHYLEKIFQIPFWLRPLSSGDEGTFRPFIEMLAGESVETARDKQAAAERARELAEQRQGGKIPTVGGAAGGQGGADAKPQKGAMGEEGDPSGILGGEGGVKLVEARRKLQLTEAEITFLSSPQIAALAATAPRGVKRLVNVYRIARARRGQEDRDAVLGDSGERAPEYPLIALMAAVETGQSFKIAEWFYDLLKISQNKSVLSVLLDFMAPDPVDPNPRPDTDLSSEVLGALYAACGAAAAGRGDEDLTADDLLKAARLVRRYSFNRYR